MAAESPSSLPLSSTGPVRSQDRAGEFVAAHDEFEQVLGGGVRQFAHAQVVDDFSNDFRKAATDRAEILDTLLPKEPSWIRGAIVLAPSANEHAHRIVPDPVAVGHTAIGRALTIAHLPELQRR